MASTGLTGPYAHTSAEVDNQVTRTSAGAYALGRTDSSGTFLVSYVGRSDDDLNNRLKTHASNATYKQFKYGYMGSSKAAFEKECTLYHDFGESSLDNKIHPARPANSTWSCPKCTTFDQVI
ncbi:hypothetical protein GCM10011611_38830 [Aliidongia dinghuensis]|uniref:GIY-YIG domain-containing protein n=1 Tax=Aliidongia dinghuensis TaxID=1867774 RepID=A0A8J2YVN6_9PROT|nr:hypothetical protein GCM10011611_38830 [Aliidongia dinghuensis]